MKLLVVDDMRLVNNTLHGIFTKKGYEVSQAMDLAQAKEQIAQTTFDYIILDLILPDGEGEELLLEVMRTSQHKSRVIVLTSDDDIQRRQYFFQHGALDYFIKNQSLDFIAAKIDTLIRHTHENHKSTVVIVDDSSFIRNSLKQLLNIRNYRVLTAPDAKSGMQLLMEDNPALLILDLEMPGMHGDELLATIKRNPRFIELPVIILSGSNDRDAIARVMKAGADDFIQKPYATEELLLKIDSLVSAERKDKALAHRERLLQDYQRVVDIADIVCKTDPKGIITYVNDQFCAYSGYSAEELIGHDINIVRHPEVPESFYKEMWETINAKRSWSGFFRNLRKDGSDYYIDTTIAPLLGEEGEIEEFIALSHDITALMQAKTISEEIAHAKSEFLAHMSHEVRTPLNAVNGYIHLLLQSDVDATQRKYLEVIDSSSKMLLSLINNILDQAKAQSGKLELNPEPVSLCDELEPVVNLFAAKAEEAAVKLIAYIDPTLPRRIVVDILRLKQVLSNLLGNAVKFTPEEGEIRVIVRQKASDGKQMTVEFAVEDTGIGISEDQKKKIFSPYQQATNSISKHFGGTGLGLSICKEYVTLLGGELQLQSTPQQGSRFFFTLQLPVETPAQHLSVEGIAKVALYTDATYSEQEVELLDAYLAALGLKTEHTISFIPLPDADLHLVLDYSGHEQRFKELLAHLPEEQTVIVTRSLPGVREHLGSDHDIRIFQPPLMQHEWQNILNFTDTEGETPQTQNPLADKEVLVVEDNDVNSTLLSILLQERGITPDIATNGVDALAMCGNQQYDLILMDVHMPQLNGIDTAKRLRGMPEYETTPIVIISGSGSLNEDEHRYASLKLDGLLQKPIDAADLNNLLDTLWN